MEVCCYSCVYWDKASKKVMLNARRIEKNAEHIEVKFGNKSVKLPSWTWEPENPEDLKRARIMRTCFYGNGLIRPWDECKNYVPKLKNGLLICQTDMICPYARDCHKYNARASYIT